MCLQNSATVHAAQRFLVAAQALRFSPAIARYSTTTCTGCAGEQPCQQRDTLAGRIRHRLQGSAIHADCLAAKSNKAMSARVVDPKLAKRYDDRTQR